MPGFVRVFALMAALTIATTACGGGGKVNTSTPTTVKPADPTTTIDPTVAQRTAVLAAYQEYWDAYKHSLAAANPDDPALEAHSTGEQLSLLRVQLTGLRDAPKPEVVNVTSDLHPKVVAMDSNKAVIDDCFSETDSFVTRDGQPSGTPQSFKAGGEFELLLERGTWKVSKKTHKDTACTS